MGEGVRVSGGGEIDNTIANAIIKEYLSQSGEISANNFVEFVRSGTMSLGNLVDTSISSDDTDTDSQMNAVVLDDSHAMLFIAASYNSLSSVYHYAVLFEVTSLTVIKKATLNFEAKARNCVGENSFVCIGKNRVFAATSRTATSYGTVQGCIFTVNEAMTSISWTGWKNIIPGVYDAYIQTGTAAVSFIKENAVSVAYWQAGSGDAYKLQLATVSISGTTMTAVSTGTVTSVSLSSSSGQLYSIASCIIGGKNVIVAANYKNYSNTCVLGRAYINDDLTIVVGYTQLSIGTNARFQSIAKATDSVAVLTYADWPSSSFTYYLYAIVVYISGNGLALGGSLIVDSTGDYNEFDETVLGYLGNGYVLLARKAYGSSYFFFQLLYISGTSISQRQQLYTTLEISDYSGNFSQGVVVGEYIFIGVFAAYYDHYGLSLGFPKTIKLASSKIDGVTETAASTGVRGKVSILNKWGDN